MQTQLQASLQRRGCSPGQCLARWLLLLCGALFSPLSLAQVNANYVKLEALSEVSGNPWAAMAEFNLLDATGVVIPRTGWIASANSANAAYPAASAIDGDSSTFWHTEWSPSSAPYPHSLVVNLGSTRVVGGFKYLPRPTASGTNGRIANWRFHTSTDGVNWTLLTSGSFANSANEQTVYPIKTVQYVKLEALSEVNGNPWASMAEFNLLNTVGAVIPRTGWIASANSANAAYSAAQAIDGDSSTFWHTEWSPSSVQYPHWFVVRLDSPRVVAGFTYLPRPAAGGSNGSIARWRFYTSNDGASWTAMTSGTFANSASLKTVSFAPLPQAPVSPTPVVNHEYDANANPTKVIQDPGVAGLSLATTNTYDMLNRRKGTTDAKSGVTLFGYNGREDLTQVTDPRNLVTQTPRNGLGDTTSVSSPDTGTALQTYDAAGNLKTRTDSRGVLATYSYDALNRLTAVVYSQSGQTSLSYGWNYDQIGAGFANGVGRLTSTTSPTSSTQYAYDPQGRVLTDTQRVSATAGANASQVVNVVSYGYDLAGNVTSLVYPSGRKLSITYTNGVPTLMALAKDTSSPASDLISAIEWEPFGAAKGWQWQMTGGSQAYERIYDTSGRLVRHRMGNTVRDIRRDAADRITSYTHFDASTADTTPALDQSFGYDELGRITSVAATASNWSIGYDANGNRTSVNLNGSTRTYTTPTTSNRLTGLSNPSATLLQDNAGNTYSDGNSGYTSTYNLAGRMATLLKSGVTTTYSVDGMNRRVRKFSSTGASSTIIFVYDQQGQLLGEYSSTGVPLREYVWLGGTPIAMFTPDPASSANPPLVYYFHTDHLDTPRVVVDKNNALRWTWLAEPFGTTVPDANPSGLGVLTQNLRFPGQYADQESGLNYNLNRDYDASIGRYTQSDPIGLHGGINTYAYVGSNPVSYVDPNGLQADDRPTTPGFGLPNPAAAANRNIARQVQRVLDDICRPDCAALEAEIKLIATEVRERYFAMLGDPRDLFNKATIVRISRRGGSWVGHRQQFRDKQITLRKKIEQADAAGCMVDQMDRLLANVAEPPDTPAARP